MSFFPFFKQGTGAHAQALAGTTAKVPIQLLAGTDKTTPVAGGIEYDGTSLAFTPFTERRYVALTNGIVTSDVTVANTTVETTIYSETLGAGTLSVGHRLFLRHLMGIYSTVNASDTFTIRLKIGGATVLTGTSAPKNVTNAEFTMNIGATIRSVGVTGTAQMNGSIVLDGLGVSVGGSALATVDTTTSGAIEVTIQWSSADPSNTFTLQQGHIEFLG